MRPRAIVAAVVREVVPPEDATRFVAALKAALATLPSDAWEGSTIKHVAPTAYPRRTIPARR